MKTFDVIVVGGGHAGCEAAAAASRMGTRCALITFAGSDLGQMSCNPAIGGVGKGHLVREVDALDGLMGRAADRAAIHYRMLNRSKGKAVHGPRVQADRELYAAAVQTMVKAQGVCVIEGEVAALSITSGQATGVRLVGGDELIAGAVVLSTGTFLNGRMFRGEERTVGGRDGAAASRRLAEQILDLALPMARLKTGTPPRLDGRMIAWDRLALQPTDEDRWTMSPMSNGRVPQVSCAVTRTSARTHDVIRRASALSPLKSGDIIGAGPRYCPSIEDKVERFGDRDGHQIFLEPEGLRTTTVYPNGLSTSLPTASQEEMVRSIAGLERARIVMPGYAVEYDHVDPGALDRRLALRALPGLFMAGQINGTTGYEEAAAQGLAAGLNAAAHALGREPIIFERESSYLGVMIDDLTLQGVSDPYRMLTARAEYRLRLRADNAETRLAKLGDAAGCLSAERIAHRTRRNERMSAAAAHLGERDRRGALLSDGTAADGEIRSRADWMRFPAIAPAVLRNIPETLVGPEMDELLEDAIYAPYLERQDDEVRRVMADRQVLLSPDLDYSRVGGLSNEMIEKLSATRPETLEQATRIRGITPAALSAILVTARRRAA
ncbi:MAG TPA: tRNA uridine-5-carboxymethylaminomethyl(34) synthesis enzyme MnmG [Sphingomonadaceae bacterium]|nr:tRNA uridine-5-carboxymethylaminomethyl(34) synthesis enzyme MnmG [Sphingomonadaceae bacterium]